MPHAMVTGRAPWVRSEGEAVPGSYVLSRWWRRAGAWFIDGAVLGGASLLLGTVVKEPRLVEYVIVAALTLGYFVPLMITTNGRTLGKMATGIRVIRTDLRPMNAGRVVRREYLLKTLIPSALIDALVLAGVGFSLVGFLIVACD